MRLNMREKIGFFIIILFGLTILWYIFLFLPKNSELKKIKNEILLYEVRSKSNINISTTLESEKEKAILDKFNNILKTLPKTEELPITLNNIKEIGQDSNIKILSLEFLNLKSRREITNQSEVLIEEIPINIVVQGDFFNIGQFLSYIIELPFFGGYTHIKMKTNEELYPEIQVKFMCIILSKI